MVLNFVENLKTKSFLTRNSLHGLLLSSNDTKAGSDSGYCGSSRVLFFRLDPCLQHGKKVQPFLEQITFTLPDFRVGLADEARHSE